MFWNKTSIKKLEKRSNISLGFMTQFIDGLMLAHSEAKEIETETDVNIQRLNKVKKDAKKVQDFVNNLVKASKK